MDLITIHTGMFIHEQTYSVVSCHTLQTIHGYK